jgi:ABC-type uncharacterized transport system permease subunit
MPMNTDPDRFLRMSALWCGILGAVAAIVAAWVRDVPTALGVVAGAVLGWANLWLLARTLRAMIRDPEKHRHTARGFSVALVIKWPGLLLVLALVLLYTPVAPEGVALGALLALAAASIAALRGRPPA